MVCSDFDTMHGGRSDLRKRPFLNGWSLWSASVGWISEAQSVYCSEMVYIEMVAAEGAPLFRPTRGSVGTNEWVDRRTHRAVGDGDRA